MLYLLLVYLGLCCARDGTLNARGLDMKTASVLTALAMLLLTTGAAYADVLTVTATFPGDSPGVAPLQRTTLAPSARSARGC